MTTTRLTICAAVMTVVLLLFGSVGASVTERTHNSFFTIHGVIQVFLFIIPGIPAPRGNLFLPILKGKLFLPEIYHLILIVSSG